jgi:hypothetical protein
MRSCSTRRKIQTVLSVSLCVSLCAGVRVNLCLWLCARTHRCVRVFRCGHSFCSLCICEFAKNAPKDTAHYACPLCRQQIYPLLEAYFPEETTATPPRAVYMGDESEGTLAATRQLAPTVESLRSRLRPLLRGRSAGVDDSRGHDELGEWSTPIHPIFRNLSVHGWVNGRHPHIATRPGRSEGVDDSRARDGMWRSQAHERVDQAREHLDESHERVEPLDERRAHERSLASAMTPAPALSAGVNRQWDDADDEQIVRVGDLAALASAALSELQLTVGQDVEYCSTQNGETSQHTCSGQYARFARHCMP